MREYQTYQAWKKACKQLAAKLMVNISFDGDSDICCCIFPQSSLVVAEWDGAIGFIEAP